MRQPSPAPARAQTPLTYPGPAAPASVARSPPGPSSDSADGAQAGSWQGLQQAQPGLGQAFSRSADHHDPLWALAGSASENEGPRPHHHLVPSLPGDPFASAPPPRFDAFDGYGRAAPSMGEWASSHHFGAATLPGWPDQGPGAGAGAGMRPGDVLWAGRGEAEGPPSRASPSVAYTAFDLAACAYAPAPGGPLQAPEAEAGAADDWSELQAQLPSDLGDVLDL